MPYRYIALICMCSGIEIVLYDDVIKWNHFPRNWPFVWGIHRSPVNSPHKDQWRGALVFSLIYAWMNDWVNNREAGDLRRYRAHCDVIVMMCLRCLRVELLGAGKFQPLQLFVVKSGTYILTNVKVRLLGAECSRHISWYCGQMFAWPTQENYQHK